MRAVVRRDRLEGCEESAASSFDVWIEDVAEIDGEVTDDDVWLFWSWGRGGGVATMTLGYALPLTLGIDRFDWRDPPLYDGGGDVAMPSFELLRDSERGVFGGSSEMLPFRLSLEPPSVSRDIMRCRRPERVLDDSNEMTLALMLGLYVGSSGGPASRNAIRSCAAFEMCGLLPPGVRGDVGSEMGDLTSSTSTSSPSDPAIISSKSIDSLFTCFFLVRFGIPDGVAGGGGAAFCEPVLTMGFELPLLFDALRVMPSLSRGWGTFEMEMERKRWSLWARLVAETELIRILAVEDAEFDCNEGEEAGAA